MLWQSGSFRENQDVDERVLDSMDLEREKGITILAKNTAVRYGETKINIVDTPGHADFGGEVERGLTMVDGVLLLVDASEGPLPQTRFVLRKALEARLPVILVVNKVDRPDARIEEVVNEVYELFLDLDADESQIEFPIVYSNARGRPAGLEPDELADDLQPLFDCCSRRIPAPTTTRTTAPGARHELERPRTSAGSRLPRPARDDPRRAAVAWCRADGRSSAQGDELTSEALDRSRRRGGPRRDRRVAGCRGDDRRDDRRPGRPRPLPVEVDEPSLSMTIGINTYALPAGRATADREHGQARGSTGAGRNVSLRVLRPAPDTWEVQGRGELQLAVLVELMRREGFELTSASRRS
jgi:GTP-binding protein